MANYRLRIGALNSYYSLFESGSYSVSGQNANLTYTPISSGSTFFNSLYAGNWVPNSGTNSLTLPTQTKPAKSTSILTGGYRDQRFDTEIRRVTQVSDSSGTAPSHLRHEYSRRQAWNADSTKFFAQSSSGWWFLYDANTCQVIPQGAANNGISGMAGDCEPIWHPTDPNKWWHTVQNGSLVWSERTYVGSGISPSTATLFDLTSNLAALGSPWNTVTRVWFNGEGRPSHDGRWWAMSAETSAFGSVGAIMYDRQTNTITGTVATGGNKPNWIGTSPLGNYMVLSWYGSAQSSIAAEEALPITSAAGVRIYNRTGTFVRAVSVLGEHSDLAIDKEGNEVYVSISYRGFADHGGADGVFVRRLATGTAWVVPNIEPYTGGAGFHFSGCNYNRPGWALFNKYGALDGGSYGGVVGAIELTPTSPRIFRFAHSRSTTPDYFGEAHATVNSDFTRVMFSTDWQTGTTPYEDFCICLPSFAIPSN